MSAQIQGEFDFSGLLELFNQIKRTFWSYDRSQERQAKQRAKLHNMFFSKLNPGGQLSDVSKKIQKELHKSAKKSNGVTFEKWKPTQKEDDSDDQNNTYLPSDEQLNEILGLSDNELKKLLSYQDPESLIQSKLLKYIKEPKKSNSLVQKQKQEQPDQQSKEQLQKEPVRIDWFKDYIQQTDKDDQKAKALEILLKKMADAEQKADSFFTDEIYELRYDRYQSMLKDDDVRDKITQNLVDKYPQFKNQQKQISVQIQKADKDLFIRLRDGNFTLDQLKARMAERRNNVKYVVLDDLLEILGPNFQQICERSMKQQTKTQIFNKLQKKLKKPKNSQCFEAVSRIKGMKHQNYQVMPESFTIDFKQPENCERQQRVIPKPKYKLAQSVPKLKVNYQELAQKRRENMLDPEKQKKMLNVEKLKKNLARKLILHRQLEISQMPFDSSKVTFHDMMDMFFRQSDLRNKLLIPENQQNKDNLNKSVENTQEVKVSQGRMSDYLQAFEQKKIEQKKRRMKLLFLKRLENDGVRILMSQQDRDLLKNFGNYSKQNDEKDLNQAMDADFSDCKLSDKEHTKKSKPFKHKQDSIDEQDPESQFEQLQINKLKYKCAQTKAVEIHKENESNLGTLKVKEKLFKTRDNKDIEIISTVKLENLQIDKEEFLYSQNGHQNQSTHYIKVQNQSKLNRNPILYDINKFSRNEENQSMQKCQSSPNINYQIVKNNPILWKTSTAANSQAEGINVKPQLTSTNQSRNLQSNYKSHAVQNFPKVKDAFSATIGESDENTNRNQIQQQYIENFQIQNPKSLQVTQFLKNEGHHIFSKNSLQNTQDILSLQQNINAEAKNPSNQEDDENNNQYYQIDGRGQTVLTKSSYMQEALQSPINSYKFHQNISNDNQNKLDEKIKINQNFGDKNSDQQENNIQRKPDQTNSNKEFKTLDQILFSHQNYDVYDESRNGDHQMQPIETVLMNNGSLPVNQEQNNKMQVLPISKTKNSSPQTNVERPQSKQTNFIDISKAASIFQAHQEGEQIQVKRNLSKKFILGDQKEQHSKANKQSNLKSLDEAIDSNYDGNNQYFSNQAPFSQRKIENKEIFEDQNIRRQSLQNEIISIPLQNTQSIGKLSNQIALSQARQKSKNLSNDKTKLINTRQSIENQSINQQYVITEDFKNFASNLGIPIYQKAQTIMDSQEVLTPQSEHDAQKRKLNVLKSQQKTIIKNYQNSSQTGNQIEEQVEGLLQDNEVLKYRNQIGTQSTINTYFDQNNNEKKKSSIRIKRVINSGILRNASESNYSRIQFQKGPIDPKYIIDQNVEKPELKENRYNSQKVDFTSKNAVQQNQQKVTNVKLSKFRNLKFESRQTFKNTIFLSDQNGKQNNINNLSIQNPTQERLKTALLNQRQKKDNFNMQLHQKQIIQNVDFLSNNEAFLTLDKEMAELNIRSLQLDTLQFQLMKEQCKMNNDYKSMAALARLQQRNQFDSIKTLHQHELLQKSLDRSQERQIVKSALIDDKMIDRMQSEYPADINFQNQQQKNIDIDQNYLMMAQSAHNTASHFNRNQINLETNFKIQKTSYDNSRVSRVNLLQKYNSNKQDDQSNENIYTSSSRGVIAKHKLINDNKNQDLQKIEGQNFHKKIELKKFGDIENNTISLQKNQLNRFGFVKSAVGGNRNQSKFQQNDLQLNSNIKTAQKNTPNKFINQEKNSQYTQETGENSKSFYMRMSTLNNQQIFRQISENKISKV